MAALKERMGQGFYFAQRRACSRAGLQGQDREVARRSTTPPAAQPGAAATRAAGGTAAAAAAGRAAASSRRSSNSPSRSPKRAEEAKPKEEHPRRPSTSASSCSISLLDALVDAAAQDLSAQVKAHYDRKPQRGLPPQEQRQAMYSGGGMQVRGTGAGGEANEFNNPVIDALMKTRPGPFALWVASLVTFQITSRRTLAAQRARQLKP